MEITHSDDIPEKLFRQQLQEWHNVSKFRESGSIYVYHKGILLRRHQALSIRPDLIKSIFQGRLPIVIDLELSPYEDNESLEIEFQKHEIDDKNQTYWICGIDQFLLGKSDSLFHFLRKRQAANPAISYVLFFTIDFLHPTVNRILTYTSTFLQNTYITQLYDADTGTYFFNRLSQNWKFEVSDKLKNDIAHQTARHFSLIKQAARFIRDTKSVKFNEILNHEMMKIKLKSIYENFLPSEKSTLIKIVSGANDFNPDEMASINFLKKTEWLESCDHKLRITIPLLQNYIQTDYFPQKKLEFIDSRIILGGVPVNSAFSSQEQQILRLFTAKSNQIISREEIAESIWGINWSEKYSDWAIDQIISRLRKKCTSLDLPKTFIRTVKGKGFRYVGN
jgi:DNA-binding winged helix-turn-helix (wHTH) protein